MSLIEFNSVSKIYNHNSIALENVSFSVQPREFVSIVGKSGAGKSTVLKLLIAEEKPSAGNVLFDNQVVNKLWRSRLPFLRRRIGMVFQDFRLLANKTAYENIAFAMEAVGQSKREIEDDVPQVLDLVGLREKANNYPRELSGGEQQRIALARALVHRPDLILADEPTGNLDPINTWEIVHLLAKINELGTTVILATHAKDIIDALGKRVITLDRGNLIRDDSEGRYIL